MTTDLSSRPPDSITGFIGRDPSTGRIVTRVGSGGSGLASTVRPLAEVEVWLRSGSPSEEPRRTWTDDDGRFAFRDVTSGDYRVVWWVDDRGILGPTVTVVTKS